MLGYWKQRFHDEELPFPSGRPSVLSAGKGTDLSAGCAALCREGPPATGAMAPGIE